LANVGRERLQKGSPVAKAHEKGRAKPVRPAKSSTLGATDRRSRAGFRRMADSKCAWKIHVPEELWAAIP